MYTSKKYKKDTYLNMYIYIYICIYLLINLSQKLHAHFALQYKTLCTLNLSQIAKRRTSNFAKWLTSEPWTFTPMCSAS